MNSNTSQTNEYSIVFIGFSDTERKLIDAAIKLSEKLKDPLLKRVDVNQFNSANVVIIDERYTDDSYHDINKKVLETLDDKLLVRVDSNPSTFAHSHISRPILWFKLPSIITASWKEKTANKTQKTPESARPKVQRAPAPSNKAAPISPNPSTTESSLKSILVVDDSQTTRDHLKSFIEKKGYKAVVAASVKQATSLFTSQEFDCVLMDVVMPNEDGYDGCKQIKKLASPKQIPVVMLTSKSSPFDKLRGKMAGCDAYLTKPTTLDKLFSTIANVI